MWHSVEKPAPTAPAEGLAPSPAWVRFDFTRPQTFDSIHIWNHNQANLTDRGFRKTRIYGSSDGVILVRADLTGDHRVAARKRQPGRLRRSPSRTPPKTRAMKSVVIAADAKDGNYGSDYFGLERRAFRAFGREVAEADLPVPTSMACAALPYGPYRPDGNAGPRDCRLAAGARSFTAR